MRKAIILFMLAGLAGCGSKSDLTPPPGKSLPVAPYGRESRPSAGELMKIPAEAQPERTVELRKRSEERADDPYDLPPPE